MASRSKSADGLHAIQTSTRAPHAWMRSGKCRTYATLAAVSWLMKKKKKKEKKKGRDFVLGLAGH